MAFTSGNDFNILQESDSVIVGAAAGHDTYIVSPVTLTPGQEITISDTKGTNTLQLIDGLTIAGSVVVSNALQLILSNGAIINVNGADTFIFNVGGNSVTGEEGENKDFETFAGDLGITSIPAVDDDPVYGSGGTVNEDGTITNGKVIYGSEGDDNIVGAEGNDKLFAGEGNDILRGGAGVDSMDGGAGDDTFVVVGDVSGGGKVDTAEDSAALGFPLTDLNGVDLNEDEDGAAEVIIGGDGDDTLYVYGTADISNYNITGIEHIFIRSNVLFSSNTLLVVSDITGDGSSTITVDVKQVVA